MRGQSHTLIAIVRRAVQAWRKRENWSRETVTQQIVETFERLGGPQTIGLRFDPETRDVVERLKVNADRVFRWLDDDSKDANLLPANFLPFLIAALPVDLRIVCVDEMLLQAGLSVRLIEGGAAGFDVGRLIQTIAKENGDATAALAALIDGVSDGELETAQRELTESIGKQQEALVAVEAQLRGKP